MIWKNCEKLIKVWLSGFVERLSPKMVRQSSIKKSVRLVRLFKEIFKANNWGRYEVVICVFKSWIKSKVFLSVTSCYKLDIKIFLSSVQLFCSHQKMINIIWDEFVGDSNQYIIIHQGDLVIVHLQVFIFNFLLIAFFFTIMDG